MPFVRELLKYSNDYFIETGTYQGDTIEIIKDSNKYKYIYSMELSDVFYNNCVNRFINDKNIKIFKGNSRYDLIKIIYNINCNITFWLDGHWSDVSNVACDKELLCPVLYELDQIKQHHLKSHTIIIDDIRLMDGSHFEVTTEQIIKKIYEINPNYKIIFYDDEYSQGDVLVAYIEDVNAVLNEQKICIHNYLTICKTNPQPPGLGDFIRGTIALFNYSNKYNYKLYIDDSHPIFKYLKQHQLIIKNTKLTDTIELLPPLSYDDIDYKLNILFRRKKSFCVMTNAFYTKNNLGYTENFGDISLECKKFLREIFSPNQEIINDIINILNQINISSNNYNVIHLRLGDNFIYNDSFDNNVFDNLSTYIDNILQNNNYNYILMCDSSVMALKFKEKFPSLYYWDSNKIHIGNLKNEKNIDLAIKDTLIDFFIMSQSKNIYYYAFNGNIVSGFSKTVSLIYDINYISLNIR